MPIYEFRCACGNRFEQLCKMDDGLVFLCPACGKEAHRVMSTFRRGRSSGSTSGDTFSAGSGCSGCSSSSCATCH